MLDVSSMGDSVNFQMLLNSFSTLFKVFSLLESGASQILFFVHMYSLPEAGCEVYLHSNPKMRSGGLRGYAFGLT
jgi:hypothetical protein